MAIDRAEPTFLRFDPLSLGAERALHQRAVECTDQARLLRIVRLTAGDDCHITEASGAVVKVGRDRFVLRVQATTTDRKLLHFAVKGYLDGRGERIWEVYRALDDAWKHKQVPAPLCLPVAHVPEERVLLFPWIVGAPLTDSLRNREVGVLDQAAGMLATIHRSGVVPEGETRPLTIVERTLERCQRLCKKRPELAPVMRRLMVTLRDSADCLPPAVPTCVHGDPAPDQFIRSGDRLTLLDMDMYGYTDPAYDVGQFLTELRRCGLRHAGLEIHLTSFCERFVAAYVSAMPAVKRRNIAFFHGLTLIRRLIYEVRREQPPDLLKVITALAADADAALADSRSHVITYT